MSLPPSLRARVLADARNVAPRRRLGPATAAIAIAIVSVVFLLWHGRRPSWDATAWVLLVELSATASLVSVVAVARGSILVGPSAGALRLAFVAPLVAFGLVLLLQAGAPPPERFWRTAAVCDATALLVGAPLLGVLLATRRGTFLLAPRLVGVAAGLAAGAWAHALLHWGCPFTHAGHVVLGHVLPSLPLAIAGAFALKDS